MDQWKQDQIHGSHKNPRPRIGQNISINEYGFEVVMDIKYLVVVITADNTNKKDVESRIMEGTLLKPKIISRETKVIVCRTTKCLHELHWSIVRKYDHEILTVN